MVDIFYICNKGCYRSKKVFWLKYMDVKPRNKCTYSKRYVTVTL